MSDNNINNKRIAKNTIFLYFRTILIMLVTLYTSRVVLNTLGIEDFGVYSAVGGVVAMFAFITGALSNAISRYITYGIGEGDRKRVKVVFCTSMNIQIIISVVILIFCELAGLWFLNNKMNIPPDRLVAANWVLHCSLLTFVVNLISVPYNACIIAHEHMNAYAYISISDAILKLSVAFLLVISPLDKLIAYSILLFVSALAVRLLCGIYCCRNFEESKYQPIYDKKLFYEMMSFAGWNFFSNGASVINIQGVSILVNVFFGVIPNSARGIALQVDAAVNQFVTTFTTAINPQITKSFAQDDKQRMFYLICKGAKFSYLLLLFFAIPIFFESDKILEIWLVQVPEDTPLFVRLSILGVMVTALGNTGYAACMATGKIKKYSIWITTIGSMVFVLTWIAYKVGVPVYTTYIIYICVYIFVQIVRLIIMKDLLNFPISQFMKDVVSPIFLTTIIAAIGPLIVTSLVSSTIIRVLITLFISILWTGISVYIFALTQGERTTITNNLILILNKVVKR